MSFDPIGAVAPSVTAATPAPGDSARGVTATPASTMPASAAAAQGGEFAEALSRIHDQMTQSGLGASPTDAVSREVKALLPSPWLDSAASRMGVETVAPAATGHDAAAAALQRSFDHALFVTLVGQVMGGVSKSTSTLIHQS